MNFLWKLRLKISWLVVLGFNATLKAKVISWRSVTHTFPGSLTPGLTQFSFQSHRLLFSHASAEVRGKNMLKRKFASTGYRTPTHQVMSPTCSSLSQPGRADQDQTAQNVRPLGLILRIQSPIRRYFFIKKMKGQYLGLHYGLEVLTY